MKIKLLILLGMITVPLLSVGQSTTKPVFFNKGKMSVVGADSAKTVLYVAGDFVVSRDADDATVKSEIYLKGAKTVILGNFYQDGLDKFMTDNTNKLENAFRLPTTYYGSKETTSVIEFRGTEAQVIGTRLAKSSTDGKYRPEWKATNYINFPHIVIKNNKHVTIAPEIGASVKGVDLPKGRLILDSRRLNATTDVVTSAVHTADNSSLLAHLYVDKDATINYNRTNAATIDDYGAIDVRVAMDAQKAAGYDEKLGRSLIGMGSPYEEIRSDYFMFNFLMMPYGNNILGYWNHTISNPTNVLGSGIGFVVGIDLRGGDDVYATQYAPYIDADLKLMDVDFNQRVKDTYQFGRFSFNTKNNASPLAGTMLPAGNKFATVATTDAAYANENIVYKDRPIGLIPGFNYLSNPFTTPLDLSGLLTLDATKNNPWGVSKGSTGTDIMPYAWVLNPSSLASGRYVIGSSPSQEMRPEYLYATYSYFLLKETGGTYADTGDDINPSADGDFAVIAPLQMFLVYSLVDSKYKSSITIPQSERVIESGANFLRSTTAKKSSNTPKDDFIIEVVDQKTKAYDRTAVYLRTPDEILNNSAYAPVDKVLSSVSSIKDDGSANMRTVTTEGAVGTTVNSVLYTTDLTGVALESKYVARVTGAKEVSTPLLLSPSQTAQDVVIRALRLSSMADVDVIWLDDKLENRSFELSTGNDYKTKVKPTDDPNRFVLRFSSASSGIEDELGTEKTIQSYYANGTLTISGFEDSDLGSIISVYDIQGRMMRQAKVNQLTVNITEVFAPGAYIVKVVGNKSYVSKFLVR